MEGFGSFKAKASIKRKGAGTSFENRARYDQMLKEIERKEEREEAEKIKEQMGLNMNDDDIDTQNKSDASKEKANLTVDEIIKMKRQERKKR